MNRVSITQWAHTQAARGRASLQELAVEASSLRPQALAKAAAAKAAACPDLPPQKARTSCIRWYEYHKYISSFFTQKKINFSINTLPHSLAVSCVMV